MVSIGWSTSYFAKAKNQLLKERNGRAFSRNVKNQAYENNTESS